MTIVVDKVSNGYVLTIINKDREETDQYIAGSEYALIKLIISTIGYSMARLLEDRPAFDKNYDRLNV